ncbi:hypothetical protein QJS10_CPB17g01246 [Acorus calamus]|uniref:Dihydrolipoamide acetyltransferase component of pyruvate dehydrogenase complex n=1 Tax=Acorus calamus TaxID=4465 RepID=A0AAV9CU49_ACOCL|nr:hypothetical protein QJS10_CPB17g01246 [Acorus calamus]
MVWRRICHHRNPWFHHLRRRFHSPNRLPRPIPPNPSSRLISSVSHRIFAHSGDPCLTWHRRFSSQAWIDVPTSGVVEVPLAQTGEGIAECEILRWFVEEGDLVEEFQRLCEVQVIKQPLKSLVVTRVKFVKFSVLQVGEALLKIHVEEIHSPIVNVESLDGKIDSESCEFNSQSLEKEKIGGVLATPSVRHLAKQYGIDINDIHGTGKDGRVLKEDVIAHGASQGVCEDSPAILSAFTEESVSVNEEIASQAEAATQQYYEDKTLPLRGFQRSMVKSMTMAAKVPHFHYLEEINFDALLELKDTFQNENTEKDVKHTCLPFLIKSLSLALGKYPSLNSSFNEEACELVLKGSHNVGVAMATPYGLVVPNIKKVQSLSILEDPSNQVK